MSGPLTFADTNKDLNNLVSEFFRAVSFEPGDSPSYQSIHEVFIENGLLIKNSGLSPEIWTTRQFIESRQAAVGSGELTRFHEAELSGKTEVFGNVGHRFLSYSKSGTLKGAPFVARGVVTAQFILTPAGWRISSMAWDDERPGVLIPESLRAPQP
jgi:hypothetical protein